MADTLLLGAAAVDTVIKVNEFPRIDDIAFSEFTAKFPGGSTANVAVGLSRLGVSAKFLGKVGEDDNGRYILNEFKKENVDTNGIIAVKNQTSANTMVVINSQGERVMYSLGGTALYEKAEELDDVDFINLKCLYISEAFSEVGVSAGKKAKSSGAAVFYSPGGIFCKFGLQYIRDIIDHSDYLLLNKAEAQILSGCEKHDDAVAFLTNLGVKNLIITEGSAGSCIYQNRERIFVKSFPSKVVDTTGAGDSFTAGFIKGYLMNLSPAACLKLGNACAAFAIGKLGARSSMPSYCEVQELIGQGDSYES